MQVSTIAGALATNATAVPLREQTDTEIDAEIIQLLL